MGRGSPSLAGTLCAFGTGFRLAREFTAYFAEALGAALAAYPDAKIDLEADGICMHPSQPPIVKIAG
jgi:hypothetical protein